MIPDYFDSWKDAHNVAQTLANDRQMDFGIERTRVYGKEKFRVISVAAS